MREIVFKRLRDVGRNAAHLRVDTTSPTRDEIRWVEKGKRSKSAPFSKPRKCGGPTRRSSGLTFFRMQMRAPKSRFCDRAGFFFLFCFCEATAHTRHTRQLNAHWCKTGLPREVARCENGGSSRTGARL